jgi:hypothetical protein
MHVHIQPYSALRPLATIWFATFLHKQFTTCILFEPKHVRMSNYIVAHFDTAEF